MICPWLKSHSSACFVRAIHSASLLHGHGGGGELDPKNSVTVVGDGTVGVARRLRGLGTNGSELTSGTHVSSSTSIFFGRRKGSGGCSSICSMVGRIELLSSRITSSLAGSTSLASQLECFHARERAAVWAALQDLDVRGWRRPGRMRRRGPTAP